MINDHVVHCTATSLGASFQVRTNREIHEVDSGQLARVVTKIVQIEGPVHQDEITRRAASIWGLQRTGRRIASSINEALAIAVHQGEVIQAGLFFRHVHQEIIPIRNRDDVLSRNLRKPDYLPNTEIQTALEAVVAAYFGISRDELAREVAKLFGF